VTHLRKRMLEELQRRNYSESTTRAYLQAVQEETRDRRDVIFAIAVVPPADDNAAKKEVETLLTGFGYSIIDLGNLRDGRLTQQAGGPLAGEIYSKKENVTNESHSSHRLR
jgi:predicted dinucleotide-binding enzyme